MSTNRAHCQTGDVTNLEQSAAAATDGRTRPARAAARPGNRSDTSGPGRRPVSRAESATRARLAANLSAARVPYSEIASRLGYASPSSAQRAAARSGAARATSTANSSRATILPLLDQIIARALADAAVVHPRMYRSKPILTDPNDPTSIVPDWRRQLRAVDVALRAMDQRANLPGLYITHPGPQISRTHPLRYT
jgi:hypothetical protein